MSLKCTRGWSLFPLLQYTTSFSRFAAHLILILWVLQCLSQKLFRSLQSSPDFPRRAALLIRQKPPYLLFKKKKKKTKMLRTSYVTIDPNVNFGKGNIKNDLNGPLLRGTKCDTRERHIDYMTSNYYWRRLCDGTPNVLSRV